MRNFRYCLALYPNTGFPAPMECGRCQGKGYVGRYHRATMDEPAGYDACPNERCEDGWICNSTARATRHYTINLTTTPDQPRKS